MSKRPADKPSKDRTAKRATRPQQEGAIVPLQAQLQAPLIQQIQAQRVSQEREERAKAKRIVDEAHEREMRELDAEMRRLEEEEAELDRQEEEKKKRRPIYNPTSGLVSPAVSLGVKPGALLRLPDISHLRAPGSPEEDDSVPQPLQLMPAQVDVIMTEEVPPKKPTKLGKRPRVASTVNKPFKPPSSVAQPSIFTQENEEMQVQDDDSDFKAFQKIQQEAIKVSNWHRMQTFIHMRKFKLIKYFKTMTEKQQETILNTKVGSKLALDPLYQLLRIQLEDIRRPNQFKDESDRIKVTFLENISKIDFNTEVLLIEVERTSSTMTLDLFKSIVANRLESDPLLTNTDKTALTSIIIAIDNRIEALIEHERWLNEQNNEPRDESSDEPRTPPKSPSNEPSTYLTIPFSYLEAD